MISKRAIIIEKFSKETFDSIIRDQEEIFDIVIPEFFWNYKFNNNEWNKEKNCLSISKKEHYY